MAAGPRWEYNGAIELHPEAEQSQRIVFEILPTHDVRWIQCHRCRRRFWYALNEGTPNEERWEWGKRLRARIVGQPCSEHPRASEDALVPAPAPPTGEVS